jgi:hypothetical protein
MARETILVFCNANDAYFGGWLSMPRTGFCYIKRSVRNISADGLSGYIKTPCRAELVPVSRTHVDYNFELRA